MCGVYDDVGSFGSCRGSSPLPPLIQNILKFTDSTGTHPSHLTSFNKQTDPVYPIHLCQTSRNQHPALFHTSYKDSHLLSYPNCATIVDMPYKSTASLEAQSSKWHRSRSSPVDTAPKPTQLKRKAEELGNKDDRPRKRARIEEDQNEYEMDLDQDLDLDESMMVEVGSEEERWIAVDEYGLPLLGFASTDDSASPSFDGLSRYAIDVDCIVRQGFGDGSDGSIGIDLHERFRPCGVIVSAFYWG